MLLATFKPKRTPAASRGFLAVPQLSCYFTRSFAVMQNCMFLASAQLFFSFSYTAYTFVSHIPFLRYPLFLICLYTVSQKNCATVIF